MFEITVSKRGRGRNAEYVAHIEGPYREEFNGRPAASPAAAKAKLLDDLAAIALYPRCTIVFGNGSWCDVFAVSAETFWASTYDANGRAGGSCGTGTYESALEYPLAIADTRGGIRAVQGSSATRVRVERLREDLQKRL